MSDKKERLSLPSPGDSGSVPATPEFVAMPPAFTYAEPEPEGSTIPLSHYLWILRRRRWEILAFVAASVLATIIVSSRLTPIYEATATIDIDRQVPANVVGQNSELQVDNFDADQFLATQIRLITSDSVLRPVVQKYRLNGPAATSPPRSHPRNSSR